MTFAVLKTRRSIAVRASTVEIFVRGVEHAGLEDVLTGGTAVTALGLQAAPMHGTIGHPSKLPNHVEIALYNSACGTVSIGRERAVTSAPRY